jgi:hypothetical protein
MMACLWQANPDKKNMEIISSVQQSADRYSNPDDSLGYGIPDYVAANDILKIIEIKLPVLDEQISFYPNPFRDNLTVEFEKGSNTDYLVEILDVYGRMLHSQMATPGNNTLKVSGLQSVARGVYIIRITMEGKALSHKVMKY